MSYGILSISKYEINASVLVSLSRHMGVPYGSFAGATRILVQDQFGLRMHRNKRKLNDLRQWVCSRLNNRMADRSRRRRHRQKSIGILDIVPLKWLLVSRLSVYRSPGRECDTILFQTK